MAKKTEKAQTVFCLVCKRPIEQHQRPSVRLETGKEIHAECYNRWSQLHRERAN